VRNWRGHGRGKGEWNEVGKGKKGRGKVEMTEAERGHPLVLAYTLLI